MISIGNLNKADVLAALYNASRPQGMGFLHYDPKPMTREEAEELLKKGTYFDYLKGRVMKVDLAKTVFDERFYDRDNGDFAAATVLAALTISGDTNDVCVRELHQRGVVNAAAIAKKDIVTDTNTEVCGGIEVVHLTMKDQAGILGPKIDVALEANKE